MATDDRLNDLIAAQVECLRELSELLADPLVPGAVKAEVRAAFEKHVEASTLASAVSTHGPHARTREGE